ncbi:MAG: bile acid:sodium symporter family protein [Succinivibrio sp.]
MKLLKFITDYMSVGVLLFGLAGAFYPALFVHFKACTPYLLGFVMFGMGLGLTFKDFLNVVTRPKTVLFGIAMQFVMMPLIALVLTVCISIPPEFAVGILLVGCCPGGTASNVLTYLARGNVALSVSITICTTLLSPLVTPAVFYLLAHNTIEINFIAMMLDIIKMVIAPVLFGVLINTMLSAYARKVYAFMPFISSVTIMVIVGIVCALSAEKIGSSSILLLATVCAHNFSGLALTYIISRLLRFSREDSRTLAIEIGTQNSGLGILLAINHLTAFAAVVGAIFSVVQNIIGSVFASYAKKRLSDSSESKDADSGKTNLGAAL